jgi:hypothetical protein
MKQIRRPSRSVCTRLTQLLLFLSLSGSASPTVSGADRVILRNLKVITNKTVTSFDEDGVRLSDGQVLGWHEIEKAKTAPEKQAAFDEMLGELGGHLYRIRQRLTVGDYEGLLPHAEAVYPRYVGRTSDTAYMVLQSLMWGRLASGQREAALTPYLQCYDVLRRRGKSQLPLPGSRILDFDPRTAITSEITPIWLDAGAAKKAMPDVFQAIRNMKARPEGAFIYYASLASAANDHATAEKVLRAVHSKEPPISELRDIIAAQHEILTSATPSLAVQRLNDSISNLSDMNRPLGLYWIGRHKLNSDETNTRQHGLLDLLRLPAAYGKQQPELAGAALLLATKELSSMKDVRGSVALRGELLAKFGNTVAASQMNRSSVPEKQP